MMTSPALNLQTFDKFTLFLNGYSVQICSFENTLMRLSHIYTLKARLGGEISVV